MSLRAPEPPLADDVVLLRPLVAGDAEAIAAACRDPEIPRWTTVPEAYTLEHARAFLRDAAAGWEDGSAATFAVLPRETGELAGTIGLRVVAPGVGDVGYWTARPARRRGYTTRALVLVARWALDELRFVRLELGTMPGNAASERVAEKAGFRREGLARGAFDQRGRRRDLVRWSLAAGER